MNNLFIISVFAAKEKLQEFRRKQLLELSNFFHAGWICSNVGDELNLPHQYQLESGSQITSQLFVFSSLQGFDDLSDLKKITVDMERENTYENCRTLNINPGILNEFFLFMASHKDGERRTQLSKSVWIEPQLRWNNGELVEFPWTFQEFQPRCRRVLLSSCFAGKKSPEFIRSEQIAV